MEQQFFTEYGFTRYDFYHKYWIDISLGYDMLFYRLVLSAGQKL